MRRFVSFALPAAVLLLSTSWALAQGGASPRAIPPPNCPQHSANPRPGCEAQPQSSNPLARYGFCTVEGARAPGKPIRTFYITGIFLYDLGRLNASGPIPQNQLPWVKDFRDYLTQTQHAQLAADGSANCNGYDTEAQARPDFDTLVRSATPGFSQYVQTGWQYAPNPPIAPPILTTALPSAAAATSTAGPAATAVAPPAGTTTAGGAAARTATTPPPATPQSSSPPTPSPSASAPTPSAVPQPRPAAPKPPPEKPAKKPVYAACWAEVPSHHSAYFSATFEVEAMKDVRNEFHKMVTMTYGPVGQFNCQTRPSQAEADQQLQQWKEIARAKDTIVETAWRYQ